MWVDFKTIFLAVVERYIPTKITKTKYSLPWSDTQIKKTYKKEGKTPPLYSYVA